MFKGLLGSMNSNNLRDRSGSVTITNQLTGFLYDLLRDHITPGVVEELCRNTRTCETNYSNGWLARYAFDIAKRLLNQDEEYITKERVTKIIIKAKNGVIPVDEAVDEIVKYLSISDDCLSEGK